MYTCRVLFILPTGKNFFSKEDRLEIALPHCGGRVQLRAPSGNIGDSEELIALAEGFESRETALAFALSLQAALRISPLLTDVGVSFGGESEPESGTVEREVLASGKDGLVAVLDDHPGISVYRGGLPTSWIRCGGYIKHKIPISKLQEAIESLVREPPKCTAEQEVALDLFSASQFERSFRARFLLLVTAVEVLAGREERSASSSQLLIELHKLVNQSDLPESDKESMAGTIRGLKFNSIGIQTRSLILEAGLPDSVSFWGKCYSARSELTHCGYTPFEIKANIVELESLVKRLLLHSLGV